MNPVTLRLITTRRTPEPTTAPTPCKFCRGKGGTYAKIDSGIQYIKCAWCKDQKAIAAGKSIVRE